jgi:hypothetical protein
MKFLKKQEAINNYNKLKNKENKMLFAEDVDRAGTKCFYVCGPKEIFSKTEKTAEPHFYEFWTDQTKLVFGVDIDFDKSKEESTPDEILTNTINAVIDGAKKYYNHNYKASDIIILENDAMTQQIDNPNKYSAHIIFRGLNFSSCVVTKDFFLRLDKDYQISKNFVDKSIYNMTCLRLFLSSKMGKQSILVPKKFEINGRPTSICNINGSKEDLFDFFCKTMITYTDPKSKIIGLKDIKHKQDQLMPKCADHGNDISNINIESILMNLPSKYYDEYDYWVKVGMILHTHSTETNSLYDLWNKWSAQSKKYKEREMQAKWNSFAKANSKLTIGSLIKWARDEGVVNIFKNTKPNVEDIVSSYPVKPIRLNLSQFANSQLTQLNQAKLTPDVYNDILNKKLVAVQSEKGTGKTSNLLSTLFNKDKSWINEDTSILFISSRITFGYKLLGDLKEDGFELYSQMKDHEIYSKRIICQIDSLLRLKRDAYDIIIIDECESLARYMTSTHFTKNSKASLIIAELEMRLHDAGQVYIMDADLSDRCINFYKNAISLKSNSDMHVIINDYKPYAEYKINYCQYATWLRKILLMLESNKKIVVAMASNAKAKDLNKKILDTYPEKKVLLIHKETTDEDKKNLLLKVNDEWVKYDVIIYTPSVCMGVSFDITGHFDYIFAYGCHESLGAQEWCQMIHRVRSPINKEIFVAIDQYKVFDKIDDLISYSTVEKMLCSDYYLTNFDLHNNLVAKKVKRILNVNELNTDNNLDKNTCYESNTDSDTEFEIAKLKSNQTDSDDRTSNKAIAGLYNSIPNIGSMNLNDKILYYPYRSEPIYDLYVRNSWELIENKLNFPACFFGYAKYKEYQMEYIALSEEDNTILAEMKTIREEREEVELEEKVTGIVEAPDMDSEEYQNKIKQKDEFVTKEDIYSIYRYNLRKCYNVYPLIADINPEPNVDNPDTDADSINAELEDTISNGNITRDFVMEYNEKDKMKWFRNLGTMLSTITQSTKDKLQILKDNQQYDSIITNCYIDFTTKNKYSLHYYPITIIEILGFDINDLSLSIQYPDLITRIYDAIGWCDDYKDEIAFKYSIKSASKSITSLAETEQLKYINRIIESQYGLRIKRMNNSVHKDNIMYRLDDTGTWDNLPDRIQFTPEELELPKNIYNLKRKIEPIELKLKRSNKLNDFDTTNLDIFIDDEDQIKEFIDPFEDDTEIDNTEIKQTKFKSASASASASASVSVKEFIDPFEDDTEIDNTEIKQTKFKSASVFVST